MSFLIGQSIGDYTILQEIGSGGFGKVYKVEHALTRRREAMKVLAVGEPGSLEQSERFLREIRLQASLSHPNIAAVLNAFWAEDHLVLICELLEGQSLKALLEHERLSLARALDITAQVLSALSYAQARGVIHRDVSPANIFVGASSGIVKLIDFGLAKAAADLHVTQEGPVGSLHYMSPEQVRGLQTLDSRTDIYSCGAVLYELTTGRKLFDNESSFAIMQAQVEQTPQSPKSLNAAIPERLEETILRAVAKSPEDRFQSADSFCQAVKQVRRELDKRENRIASRHSAHATKLAWAAGLMLAIALVAGALRWVPQRGKVELTDSQIAALTPTFPPPVLKPERPVAIPFASGSRKPAPPHPAPDQKAAAAPENVATEPAHKNPVVKVASVLKRLNPFRRKVTQPEAGIPE